MPIFTPFFHKALSSNHIMVYLQHRYSLPWIKAQISIYFSFFFSNPWSGLCWTPLQSCPGAKRAPDREETAGTKTVTRLDNFLHGECVLQTSKYPEGLDEKGKYLSQDIWKSRFEESYEVPTAGWFQPTREGCFMKMNQITNQISLSHG